MTINYSHFILSVKENSAQIPVTVTFDPPSPVPLGVTTFRCDFTIRKLNSLTLHILYHYIGRSKEDARDGLPYGSQFYYFHAVFGKINRLALEVGAVQRNFLIRH